MTCTAFVGTARVASGSLNEIALQTKAWLEREGPATALIFDDVTSELVEVDFRGTAADVLGRLPQAKGEDEARRPGRPKLGVVPREVTLLPRHWEWLATQSGGASVALRKLVDQARAANMETDRKRVALEAAYRFLSAMAGNEAGFEEAVRALFAGDRLKFLAMTEIWPTDIRDHGRTLASRAFEG